MQRVQSLCSLSWAAAVSLAQNLLLDSSFVLKVRRTHSESNASRTSSFARLQVTERARVSVPHSPLSACLLLLRCPAC